MDVFLIDNHNEYTYLDLLYAVNHSVYYYPQFQKKDLFSYFSNLIVALSGNHPITLIDSDFSAQEIDSLGLSGINERKEIEPARFISVDSMLDQVSRSKSSITIFTSGTTGQPKKITHDYQNLSRAVRTGAKYHDNIWGFAYNPTHMAGLQVLFQALENKNKIVNIFGFQRAEVYGAIQNNRITHLSATPTFYRLLLPFEHSYPDVERVTFGGEKSNDKLYQAISLIFPNAKLTNVYASTEAGTLFASKGNAFQIPEGIRDKVKIFEDELLVHSSLIGESETLHLDGDFYLSGDLVEWVDRNEYIFRFKSRKNELINIGGYKVNPLEVEDAIRNFSNIIDVHVYGKQNSILGNILCADIVKDQKSEIGESDIRLYLKEILQDYKIPRRIRFVNYLETTRTGKMKRI